MLTLGVKGFYPKTAYAYKSLTCAKQIITSKNKMSTIKLAKYDFLLCISVSLRVAMKQKICERKVVGAGIMEKRNDDITKTKLGKSRD